MWGNIPDREFYSETWQFRNLIDTPEKLFAALLITDRREQENIRKAVARVPLRITPYYLSLIQGDYRRSPIGRQCIPSAAELSGSLNQVDPLTEDKSMKIPGLINRYENRALILAGAHCATYCRFCSRKRLIGKTSGLPRITSIVRYLRTHSQIDDVIVSGGDPLLSRPGYLDELLTAVKAITRIRIIRLASRIPATMPMRMENRGIRNLLKKHNRIWFVTQFNHPFEINPWSMRAVQRIREQGIPVLNQTVLLKGINDTYPVLKDLCRQLAANQIKPYYLFACEKTFGNDRFLVSLNRGVTLMNRLRREISGLALPQFVVDVPGARAKVPVCGHNLSR